MARQRWLLAAPLVALVLLLATSSAAAAGEGFANDDCDLDGDCMSRKCVNGKCAATTCGLSVGEGGVGTGSSTFCTNAYTTFNPSQVCVFGYGQCTRAECCDTKACSVGVPFTSQAGYCTQEGQVFTGSRLCKNAANGGCAPADCCTVTQCDSPGGVPVDQRPSFCPSGEMFDNVGVCAGGAGACTTDECCMSSTRTCAVAFESLGKTTADCTNGSTFNGTRIYDAAAGTLGGCCVTVENLVTQNECTQALQGSPVEWVGQECKCVDTTRVLVAGSGCLCPSGKYSGDNGACTLCPHGRYAALPNNDAECTACPTNLPYTSAEGSQSVDDCANYCDQSLLGTTDLCSNGGTCSSLSGAGSTPFSCTCPTSGLWMSATTAANNCDAPTTLLRVRLLKAADVTLPTGFKINVNYVALGATPPAYAVAAPADLACSVTDPTSTGTTPGCPVDATYALGGSDQTKVRTLLNAKVRLSATALSAYNVQWSCSDGTATAAATYDVVLPGPASGNPNGQTLVCTAIVRSNEVELIQVKLAADGAVPDPATNTRAAQLTFVQAPRPVCVADANAASKTTAATLACPYSGSPFASNATGTLGVSNIDMEKYTVTWSCKVGSGEAVSRTTNAAGVATTLPLVPGETMVCEATFVAKGAQLTLTASSAATTAITLTATQADMNEPCVATIPANAAANTPVTLSCPFTLATGKTTTLATSANLELYLVEFTCSGTGTSRRAATVAPGQGAACSVAISVLPPLLEVKIAETNDAPNFKVIATQRAQLDACALDATGTASSKFCPLSDGMKPSLATSLTPRGLDVDAYQVAWACTNSGSVTPNTLTNTASVTLGVNPNWATAGETYPTVVCTGTVTARSAVVNVVMVNSGATDFNAAAAELLVRQPHQSQACSSTNPTSATAPTCPAQALRATANTRTTLSTRNIDLSKYRVAWACTGDGVGTVTTAAAGVATVSALGPNKPLTCTATVSNKPALLELKMATAVGTTAPATAWSLTARQSQQGRACTATAGTDALAPACTVQDLLPSRATVLSTSGLDLSRYSVAWACNRGTVSESTTRGVTAYSVTLDKDPNANGVTTVCTATITANTAVLLLKAEAGGASLSGITLTSKQSTQSEACTLAAPTATAAAPTCSGAATATGLSVELGVTGLASLGTSYYVSGWSCNNGATASQAVAGAATTTVLKAGTTTCTVTIASSVAPIKFTSLTDVTGATVTARQGSSNVCSFSSGTEQACPDAAASTATTLSVAGNANPTFVCSTAGGTVNVPVSRLSATSVVVMTPPAGVQMTCTVALETAETRPIISLSSNVPTTLKVEYIPDVGQAATQTCAAPSLGRSLSCAPGTGATQLTPAVRVKLSHSGYSATGFYRWMCNSSDAAIERSSATDSTATATVLLPAAGTTLRCNLQFWSQKPSFIARRMMM